jgi:hypothetical protein
MKTILTLAALAIALTGCATYPSDPNKQAAYHITLAKAEFDKGQYAAGAMDIMTAADRTDGALQVRALFAKDEGVKIKFAGFVKKEIDEVAGMPSAKQCSDLLRKIARLHILDNQDVALLTATFERNVIAANISGAIPFTINSDALDIEALSGPDQRTIMFGRTLDAYSRPDYSSRDIPSVVAYVQTAGAAARADFISRLPHLNIRGSEIPAVAPLAPAFAERRKREITLDAHLVVKNADRIFADDLSSSIARAIRGVTWLSNPQNEAVEIMVERVRNSEKEFPSTTRTVTYSNSQVDILSAVLLMPKGASYQFDMRTGGAEIEYGYVVSAWKGGKQMSESVVRGKIGGQFRSCENARIVNVFGGVTSAGFDANDDMRSACSNQTPVSLDVLRNGVLTAIAEKIRDVPQVAAVNAMN